MFPPDLRQMPPSAQGSSFHSGPAFGLISHNGFTPFQGPASNLHYPINAMQPSTGAVPGSWGLRYCDGPRGKLSGRVPEAQIRTLPREVKL